MGKILRIVGIILVALTIAFQFLGGIGTSCVALGAEKYGPEMAPIVPYKWLYQIIMVLTIIVAVYGIRTTVRLARGKAGATKETIIVLFITLVLSGIQMIASEILRGSSTPTNMRVYFTILTLIVLGIFHIPSIREKVNFERVSDDSKKSASGMAMIMAGALMLSIEAISTPSHTFSNGINYALDYHIPLMIIGTILILGGITLLTIAVYHGKVDTRQHTLSANTNEL